MEKTQKRFSKYWDKLILRHLPPYAKFKKFAEELRAHFNFSSWLFKRIILPLAIFYVIIGLLLKTDVFGSLFISILIFTYSNIIPDIDILIKKPPEGKSESLWYELYALLFFAPLIVYYIIDGKAHPLYSQKNRPFHSFRTVIIYGFFLLIIGAVFWSEALKIIMLPIFGGLGFLFHLMIDNGKINNQKTQE